jgi:site-specific recombinase XerD
MLSDEQLSLIVRDFYDTVIRQENALRLNGQHLSEEARQARIAHFKEVSERTRKSLGSNQLADAEFVSEAMLRKHKLAGTLKRNEINQVRQAILRAGIDLADHMKARYEGDFNHQPKDQLLKAQSAHVAPIQPKPATETQASKPTGPLFSEIAKTFLGRQVQTRAWEKQTASQAEKSIDLFIEVNGDLPIETYTREHAARFKEVIQRLPANYGKAAAYRGLTLDAIIETVSGTVANKSPALTQKTVKRHFSALSTLWGALISEGRRTENIFTGFKFGNSKRANEQRDMWTEDELGALFSTPVWRGCKSAWHRSAPGLLLIRDEKFWVPLIAVFSGLRQEEICQLHVDDVRQEDGIWYFDINNRPPRN